MTNPNQFPAQLNKSHIIETRRDMLRLMSEVSFNPANVVPEKQEELAAFLVSQLRSSTDLTYSSYHHG